MRAKSPKKMAERAVRADSTLCSTLSHTTVFSVLFIKWHCGKVLMNIVWTFIMLWKIYGKFFNMFNPQALRFDCGLECQCEFLTPRKHGLATDSDPCQHFYPLAILVNKSSFHLKTFIQNTRIWIMGNKKTKTNIALYHCHQWKDPAIKIKKIWTPQFFPSY